MKIFFKLFLFGLCLTHLFAFEAREGHETGHGGDSRASNFVSMAYQILSDLQQRPVPGIDLAKLEKAILATRVRSSIDILIDVESGKRVDAINHPEKMPPEIVVNQAAWDSIAVGYEKRRLVLHEYLSISGLDDRRYELSSRIDRAGVCKRAPALRVALEKAFGGTACDKISEEELRKLRTIEFGLQDSMEQVSVSDLKDLNIEELNVIAPKWRGLDARVWSDLKRLAAPWDEKALLDRATAKNYKKLKRLELHTVTSLNPKALREWPALEELVLVSAPEELVYVEPDTFSGLSKSPLRRLVLCDLSESGQSNFVRIPNFVLKKDALRGLSRVEEATLCLSFDNDRPDAADKNLLKALPRLKHLWFKTDDWSTVPDDFFATTPTGTRIALVPSGRQLKAKALERFKGLDCKSGWDWTKEKVHQFVSGKVYCTRN